MRTSLMRLGRFLGVAMVPILFLCGTSRAQQTATFTGTVTDPNGAVINNAKVTATDEQTGTAQATVTNGDGLYNLPGLAVGHYTIEVEAQGFETFKRTGVVADAAMTLREDARLTVGKNIQTVTVEATALQVQSESNEISTLISGQQVRNIATNGRNITSLYTLGTGVSWNGPAFNGVTAQNSVATISFNGLRPDHNNFLIDGGEVYDRGSGGKLDVLPSPDAIGQFQVLASNYSPDYGIASGGTVLAELKSGTRQFHGGVWEFNRNDTFDAKNYFSKQTNTPTPELRLNIFGGNIGGPVYIPHVYNNDRQKTFFFVNEEWRRFINGVSPEVTSTVPASNFPASSLQNNCKTGNFCYTPWNGGAAPVVPAVSGNSSYTASEIAAGLVPGATFPTDPTISGAYDIPKTLLDPNSVLFMGTGAIPQPNVGTDNYVSSPKQPTYVREDVVRIDQNFSDKYHLMGSWIHDSMSQTVIPVQWSGDNYNTVGDVFNNPSWAAAIRLTQTISPTVLNETGLYVNGNTIDVTPYSPLGPAGYTQPSGWSASSFFTNNNALNRMPSVQFSNGPINTEWTVLYWPWHNSYLDYQIRDDISWTRGRHALKFGFSYMRQDKNQQLQADTQGDYTFSGSQYSKSSYLNFLLGMANTYQQLQAQRTDHWLSNNFGFYGWDNWHVTSKFSLQLGLRYDALPHTYEKNNQVANFVPAYYSPANAQVPSTSTGNLNPAGPGFATVNGTPFYLNGIKLAGVNGFPRGLVKNNYFTWQPRLGFAWDFLGNGKTVLRGGLGVFYERLQGNDIYNLDTTPPFAYQPGVNNVFFSSPQTSIASGAVSSLPAGPASLTNMSYYYPHPADAQYSLGIQQQLAPALIGAVQYVGSSSWNQDVKIETNDLPLNDILDREQVATSCTAVSATAPTCPGTSSNANVYRPYLGFSNIVQETNPATASYNSLQVALRMDNRHGLSLQLAYTYSHEIDIASTDLTTQTQSGQSTINVSDPYNLRYDRGSGLYDRRHIFNANWVYDMPFFAHSSSGWARQLLGGWQFAGVNVSETGSPQNIYYNGPDVLGLGGNAVTRPNIVSAVKFPRAQKQWFATSSFANPVAPWLGGTTNGFGDAGKDTIVQPGLFNWNMSLYKEFPLSSRSEGPRFQFRAETYNTFNHTQFNDIDTGTTDSTYGQVTSVYDPRVFQFGGKFMF